MPGLLALAQMYCIKLYLSQSKSFIEISSTMAASRFFQIFLLIAAVHLASLYTLPEAAQLGTKALLMPLLMAAVWAAPDFSGKKLLLGALFLSWVGDVSIGFSFVMGLVAFLLAHICYIALFYKAISTRQKTKPYLWAAWALLAGFIIGLLSQLLPGAGELKIPVTVYAVVIGSMLGLSIAGRSHWPSAPAGWIIAGAGFFVLSDSLLAWNKFHSPLPLASLLIMLTYIAAQYAIAKGVLMLAGGSK